MRNDRTTGRRGGAATGAQLRRARLGGAAVKLGGSRSLNLVVDGFNLFNSGTATQVDYHWEYGKITGIPGPRRFRGSVRFNF